MNNRIGKWFDFLYADNSAVGMGEKTTCLSTMIEEAKNESRKNVSVSKFVAAVIREKKNNNNNKKH